jgi:hypothetical protein
LQRCWHLRQRARRRFSPPRLGGPTPSSVSGEMHEEKHVTPVYLEKV